MDTPKTDNNIVDEIINFNYSAMEEFQRYYQEAEQNVNSVFGDHWNEQQKAKFTEQGRLPINLPVMFPKVQSLLGFEKDNRDRLEAEPVGQEDELTSEVITQLFRHIENQDNPKKYEFTKSDVYQDAIVACYGATEIYTETNLFKKTEVFVKHIPYNQILFDRNFTDYEMRGCRRFQQHWTCYLDDLKAEHPDKNIEWNKIDEDFHDSERFPLSEDFDHYYNSDDEEGHKRIRRIRDWKLVNGKIWILNDIVNKEKYEFTTKEEAEEKRDELHEALKEQAKIDMPEIPSHAQFNPSTIATPQNFEDSFIIESEPREVWEYTEIAGTVLIQKPTVLDIPDECPITITYSIFLMGKWFTPVRIMKSLQDYIDRLFSQLDYSIGIDAKGGAEVDVNLIATEYNTADDLKVSYTEGGLSFKDGQGHLFTPMQRTGANAQYFTLFEMFFKLLEDGFGGRNSQGSAETGQQSGKAISQLLAVAQILTNNYLDNLRRSDLLMGKKLYKYIKKYYDYEFTLSVIGDSLEEKVREALETNEMYKPSLLKEGKGWLVYDPTNPNMKTITDTSVLLSLSKSSARMDEKELTRATLLGLKQQGYYIPLESMIDSLPLKATMKSKIIAYNNEMEKQAQQEREKMMQFQGLNAQAETLNKAGETASKMANSASQGIVNEYLTNQPTKDQNTNQ